MRPQQDGIVQQAQVIEARQPVCQPLAGQGGQIQNQPRGPVQARARQKQAQSRTGQHHKTGHGQPEHIEREPEARIVEQQEVQRQQRYLDQQGNQQNARKPAAEPVYGPTPGGFGFMRGRRQYAAQPGQGKADDRHAQGRELQARVQYAQRRDQADTEQGGAEHVEGGARPAPRQPEGQDEKHAHGPQQGGRSVAQPEIGQGGRTGRGHGQDHARLPEIQGRTKADGGQHAEQAQQPGHGQMLAGKRQTVRQGGGGEIVQGVLRQISAVPEQQSRQDGLALRQFRGRGIRRQDFCLMFRLSLRQERA